MLNIVFVIRFITLWSSKRYGKIKSTTEILSRIWKEEENYFRSKKKQFFDGDLKIVILRGIPEEEEKL